MIGRVHVTRGSNFLCLFHCLVPGVIAYNGDSERGWNDPPTLSFNGATASKKISKLDLRKRVSHQEALTGRKIISPSTQNAPNLYKQTNQLTNGKKHVDCNKFVSLPRLFPYYYT